MILRTAMVLLWFGASASFAENNEREPAMEPGRALAERIARSAIRSTEAAKARTPMPLRFVSSPADWT